MLKKAVLFISSLVSIVTFAAPIVTDVVAKQRYPWNGLVDVRFTITGSNDTKYYTSFVAKDVVGDINVVIKTVCKPDGTIVASREPLSPGTYNWVWDTAKDLPNGFESGRMTITIMVDKKEIVCDSAQLWSGGPYWATMNIGAKKPEDYGYYFWWGDTVGYKLQDVIWVASDGSNSNYSFNNAPTDNKDRLTLLNEGWISSSGVLALEHDAAQVQWGGNWRMPTKQDFEDLINKCNWKWTRVNGVDGYLISGKGAYTSENIFLPCAGYGYGSSIERAGSYGAYWSSEYDSSTKAAWGIYFYWRSLSYLGVYSTDIRACAFGQPIRPLQRGVISENVGSSIDEKSCEFALFKVNETGSLIMDHIAYNSTWIGGNPSAEVVISTDGTEIMRSSGEGDFAWSPTTAGKHTLTYTTYINGIAQDEVYEVTVFKDWKYAVEDGKAVIIETSQNSGHVSIPMEIDGYRVDGLKDGLFAGCDNITSVSMPGYLLTKISDIFPDSFEKLTSITLLDGTVEIPEGAFSGCVALREVIIPKSVVKIGKNVFEGCSSLDLVTQDGFIICQGWCLGYVGGAATSLCIPNGVYGVADGAFKDCTSLQSITFPTSLRFIGEDAFAGCTGIEEILLPEGLARVNDRAFCNCTYAQTVKLPSTLQVIGDRSFENCTSFSSVECPEALKIIGEGAFSNCWRMLSVSLPVGVESIGENAFLDCRRLIGVSVPTHLKTIKELFPSAYANLATIEIADTENTLVPRIFAECSSLIEVEIPEGIRLIPEEAFVGCSAVQSFNLPNTITNIGARAFSGLTQMTSFAFPAEVETIADEAFAGCVNLASLPLPEGVQYIGRHAFSGLSLLARADIPGTVVEMGDSPFAGCGQVRAVSMPGNVATVKSLFPDAYGEIVSASVTVGTTCVADRLFADCTKLTSVDLPFTLVEIGEYAFENCTFLADMGIPSGVERLGEGAFLNCASLAKIALPNRLVIIPYRAFAGCETLAEIVIPENVSELDDSIFVGCSRLSKVYFVGNAPSCTVSTYDGVSASLVTYVENGSTGWDGIETSKTLPEFWPEGTSNLITYWTPNRYDVTFNLSGGGDSFDVEQVTGTTYLLPLDPKRKGAVFDGWWTSLDGGARVTAVTPVDLTRPHTFYARWEFNAYSVVFNANGGSGEMEDQRLTVETPVQLPENGFTRPGYEFLGWATAPDGEVVYSDKAEVVNLAYDNNAIVTLYAVWNEREWTWADAVNATSIGLVFSGDGNNDAEWEIDYSTSHDGVASLKSGVIGASAEYPERAMSTVKTEVVGDGAGEFWWKVNCEEMDAEYDDWYDYVVFTIDGEEVAKIAGDSGWQKVEYIITGAGKHTLAWTFTRDHYDEDGAGWENAAWLDEFVWTPNPVTVTFDAGGADGEIPTPVVKYAGYELTLPGVGTLNNGEYVFRGWSDGKTTYQAGTTYVFGSDDVTLTAVWELKVWTFAEAADAEGLVLTTGGDADWTIDATSGYTNTMSVKSGVVVSGQESWIETKVNGSGILTFRWKVMGGQNRNNPFAYAKVVVDDTEVASEYLTDGWEEVVYEITGNKEHTIRWTYLRTSTRPADGDCAWLDAVVWTPAVSTDLTVDVGGGKSVVVPTEWIDKYDSIVTAAGGDKAAALMRTAANGRKVWECFMLGVDPTKADDDFKITRFWMEDGKPMFEFSHSTDGAGNLFTPRIKTKGKAKLSDVWSDVPAAGDSSFRFFTVEVALP